MFRFLKKALERGLTLPNVASYVSLQTLRLFGAALGSLRLALKARLLENKRLQRQALAEAARCLREAADAEDALERLLLPASEETPEETARRLRELTGL